MWRRKWSLADCIIQILALCYYCQAIIIFTHYSMASCRCHSIIMGQALCWPQLWQSWNLVLLSCITTPMLNSARAWLTSSIKYWENKSGNTALRYVYLAHYLLSEILQMMEKTRHYNKTKRTNQTKPPKKTKTKNCSIFVLHCTGRHGRQKEQSQWLTNTTAHH